ncbi:Protein-tyrosine phosphatase rolB [Quillaja saponaria]|uniref:Protein-tyrosine phosphatase rolB n=1 Tax=Quillaja saponaria TaxID=32244 RepID=A0AAD7PZA4_QUISA|nr:Protein-tyrosine phosphatase rolB [Quillaja saponaria]
MPYQLKMGQLVKEHPDCVLIALKRAKQFCHWPCLHPPRLEKLDLLKGLNFVVASSSTIGHIYVSAKQMRNLFYHYCIATPSDKISLATNIRPDNCKLSLEEVRRVHNCASPGHYEKTSAVKFFTAILISNSFSKPVKHTTTNKDGNMTAYEFWQWRAENFIPYDLLLVGRVLFYHQDGTKPLPIDRP